MKEFIESIEIYFNEPCLALLDKAIAMLLSPVEITEIIYYYMIYKKNTASKDKIMFKIADLSLEKIIAMMKNIKEEALQFSEI